MVKEKTPMPKKSVRESSSSSSSSTGSYQSSKTSKSTKSTKSKSTKSSKQSISIKQKPEFYKTPTGILKIVCLVADLIGFLCIMFSNYRYTWQGETFTMVSAAGFCLTLMCITAMFLCEIHEKCSSTRAWEYLDLAICGFFAALFLVVAIATVTHGNSALTAASVCGFIAMVSYGSDAYLSYRIVKRKGTSSV